MKLSQDEARRLQQLEQRLAVDDPDLASLLSTGLEEPDPPARVSPRLAPHGLPARGGGTATAMVLALVFLALLVLGAHALTANPPADEGGSQCPTAGCEDFRRYVPGE
ncbi:hypothetical protein Acsp03_51180 [Actinomadura sp. NBRC 104412]|uniref:DUF3040 domain-containing protein n=1 Tax=Actinomadura sp. NBRC 104412 TaxID=3032203 RepID=UPI0024A4DAB5|nr:DUF3040 domain-containing protein [Actinomadura sp. NBRC 104412]GLZ07652.1 hypothetical protein Acsp03_51180 [Actinomadura sp. NBRC 104412]